MSMDGTWDADDAAAYLRSLPDDEYEQYYGDLPDDDGEQLGGYEDFDQQQLDELAAAGHVNTLARRLAEQRDGQSIEDLDQAQTFAIYEEAQRLIERAGPGPDGDDLQRATEQLAAASGVVLEDVTPEDQRILYERAACTIGYGRPAPSRRLAAGDALEREAQRVARGYGVRLSELPAETMELAYEVAADRIGYGQREQATHRHAIRRSTVATTAPSDLVGDRLQARAERLAARQGIRLAEMTQPDQLALYERAAQQTGYR